MSNRTGLIIFGTICLLRFLTPYVIEMLYRREVPQPRGLAPGRDALVEAGRAANLAEQERYEASMDSTDTEELEPVCTETKTT